MNKLFIISFLLFNACAYQDPYFYDYIGKIKEYCLEYAEDTGNCDMIEMVSIRFADGKIIENGDNNIIAYCYSLDGIYIDKEYWDKSTELIREVLLLHEYGHCALHRGHNQETELGYIPKSIMFNPSGSTARFYLKDKDYYLDELFNGG